MEQINLNLIPNGILAVCHVSQYDNTGRKIRFHLFNGSDTYALSGTETITLRIRKTNGEILIFDIPNTASDYIDLTVLQQMTNVSGDSVCEFRLTDSGLDIGSFNFKMKIEPDAFDGNLSISEVSGNIATFKTDIAEDLIKLDVDLEPVQDLHGYDYPWPSGGKKNKLPPNGTDSSTTINGITFTASNGVYTIKGTSTEAASISYPLKASVDMSPSTQKIVFLNTEGNTGVSLHFRRNGSNIHYWQMHPANRVASNWADTGNELIDEIMISVAANKTVNMTISLMFLLLSETNETPFAPYSNICPITGHDSAQLFRVGKNLFNNSLESVTINGTTIVVNEDKSVTISGTPSARVRVYLNNTDHLSFDFRTYFSCGIMPTGTRVFCSRKINGVADYPTISPRLPFQNGIEYYNFMLEINTSYDGTPFTIYPQLEVGSAATDYEPYASDHTPITVNFGQTVYKGILYSKLRKVLVTHVCETFDGSEDENWVSTTTTSVRYGFRIYFQHNKKPTAQAVDEMLSSVIPLRKSSETASVDDNIITCRSTTYLYNIFYIFAPPSKISTVEELRAFLANEPETVMYPLNEPFYIDLSQEQTEDVEKAAIASFETNIQRPLETSEHYFSCSQAEGTPTPDSPIPITGVSGLTAARIGKNLCSPMSGVSENGLTTTVNSDGTIHVTGTATGSGGFITGSNVLECAIPSDQQITISISNTIPARLRQFIAGVSRNSTSDINIGGVSTTFSKDFEIVSISLYLFTTAGQSYDFSFKFQVEFGSTATEYEPYSGESITVSLGGTYYGGKLVQSEDGSRKIVLTHGLLSKAIADMNNSDTYPGWRNSGIRDMVGAGIDGSETGILNIGTNYAFNTKGTNDIVYLPRGSYNNLTQPQWIENYPNLVVQILVPLAEPLEVSLPDGDPLTSLVGQNNVYCNTGDTAVKYYYNMVSDPIRIPALVGTNNVYSDAGDVDVKYYTTLEGGNG